AQAGRQPPGAARPRESVRAIARAFVGGWADGVKGCTGQGVGRRGQETRSHGQDLAQEDRQRLAGLVRRDGRAGLLQRLAVRARQRRPDHRGRFEDDGSGERRRRGHQRAPSDSPGWTVTIGGPCPSSWARTSVPSAEVVVIIPPADAEEVRATSGERTRPDNAPYEPAAPPARRAGRERPTAAPRAARRRTPAPPRRASNPRRPAPGPAR